MKFIQMTFLPFLILQLILSPVASYAGDQEFVDNFQEKTDTAIENFENVNKEKGLNLKSDDKNIAEYLDVTGLGSTAKTIGGYIMFFLVPSFLIDVICMKPYNDFVNKWPYAWMAMWSSFLASILYVISEYLFYISSHEAYDDTLIAREYDNPDPTEDDKILLKFYSNLRISLVYRVSLLSASVTLYSAAYVFWKLNNATNPVSLAEVTVPKNKCTYSNWLRPLKRRTVVFSFDVFKYLKKIQSFFVKTFSPMVLMSSAYAKDADDSPPLPQDDQVKTTKGHIRANHHKNFWLFKPNAIGKSSTDDEVKRTIFGLLLLSIPMTVKKFIGQSLIGRMSGKQETNRLRNAREFARKQLKKGGRALWALSGNVNSSSVELKTKQVSPGANKGNPKSKLETNSSQRSIKGAPQAKAAQAARNHINHGNFEKLKTPANLLAASVVSYFMGDTLFLINWTDQKLSNTRQIIEAMESNIDHKNQFIVE